MHEKWQELIPFYVAGSLPGAVAASVEQHLAQCMMCRKEYEEWYALGKTVYAQAEAWAKPLPPLSQAVRMQAQMQPAHGRGGSPLPDTQPYESGTFHRVPRPSVTLAAAAVVLLVVGVLFVFTATRPHPDDGSQYGVGLNPTVTPNLSPLLTNTPPNTPIPTSTATHTVTPIPSATPTVGVPTKRPIQAETHNPQVAQPTPVPAYAGMIGGGYDFLTTTEAGLIPPNSRVHIISARYNGTEWIYTVGNQYNNSGEVRESQLLYSPYPNVAATPTALYSPLVGVGGYNLITVEPVGNIPANTRVRITYSSYDGVRWHYGIVAQDETTTAEALEAQLTYAPGYSLANATPTAVFDSALRSGGYVLITLVPIGNIPPNTHVAIGSAFYDGSQWHYGIVTQDGTASADALDSQLTYAPDYVPYAATPAAQFSNYIGMSGYNLVTTQQVGNIAPNTRVRVSSAYYDGYHWHYTIVSEGEAANADALDSQLTYAPGTTPNAPTPMLPTVTPSAVPPSGYCSPSSGCPGYNISTLQAAYQPYQNGFMIWRSDTRIVWIFTNDGIVTWFYPESYENQPDNPVTDSPPAGLVKPISGFGRVWGNNAFVQNALGWATAAEQGYSMTLETDSGQIFYYFNLPDGRLVQLSTAQSHWVFLNP